MTVNVVYILCDVQPDFLLIDGMKGGSGEAIDWEALEVPVHEATKGWLLAGGLSADNVAQAASTAGPSGVDVSSGVTLADGEHLGIANGTGLSFHRSVAMQTSCVAGHGQCITWCAGLCMECCSVQYCVDMIFGSCTA